MKASGIFHGRSDKNIGESRTKDSTEALTKASTEALTKASTNVHGFESFHESTSKEFCVLVPWKQAADLARKVESSPAFTKAFTKALRETFESSFQEILEGTSTEFYALLPRNLPQLPRNLSGFHDSSHGNPLSWNLWWKKSTFFKVLMHP